MVLEVVDSGSQKCTIIFIAVSDKSTSLSTKSF
jgi:hypothetical protein